MKKKRCFLIILILLLAVSVLVVNHFFYRSVDALNGPSITVSATATSIDMTGLRVIPPYENDLVVSINNNTPDFDIENITAESYDLYSKLDALGRTGTARACIGKDILPTSHRSSLAGIEPAGWNGNCHFFNRSHVIGNQLTGNDTAENIFTGTEYLNIQGMLPFENKVAMYVSNTGNHVLYRVTPLYEGSNLLATAVEMEAMSIEDEGHDICFHVIVYNVEPGYHVDYATGSGSEILVDFTGITDNDQPAMPDELPLERIMPNIEQSEAVTYILNTNTKRFHYPYCDSVKDMKEKNKEEFFGTRDEVIAMGYQPCGVCQP